MRKPHGVVDGTPGINQFTFAIEYKEVRSSQGSVFQCNLLRFVVKIGPRKVMFLHSFHHIREAIFFVCVLAIGVNGHKSNAFVGVFQGCGTGGFVGSYHIRTMVAGKKNNQRSGVEIAEPIGAAVGSRKLKIGGRLAYL